jgi:hypothetical protein
VPVARLPIRCVERRLVGEARVVHGGTPVWHPPWVRALLAERVSQEGRAGEAFEGLSKVDKVEVGGGGFSDCGL